MDINALLRNPDMSKLRYIADEQSEHLLPCSSQVKLVVTSPYEAAVQQITAAEQFLRQDGSGTLSENSGTSGICLSV